MEMENKLIVFLSEESGIPIEDITSDMDIFNDLNLDSLALINIVMNIENSIGYKMELDDFSECRIVSQINDRFRKSLAESIPQA